MPNATWFLHGQPMGQVQRSPDAANLHVLCPDCGDIWARVESHTPHHWTCAHRRCSACGIGTLADTDWTSQPYNGLNLPTALLTRELDIASSFPDKYN